MAEETSMFSNDGLWIFALLILLGMGGGSFFGGNGGRTATVEDLNTQSNFTRTEAAIQANGLTTERKTDAIINGLSTMGYESAKQTYELNSAISNSTAQIIASNQAIKDQLAKDKIEALQAKVQSLELAQAMCGVVKYPMATTYSVASPCFNGCSGTGY